MVGGDSAARFNHMHVSMCTPTRAAWRASRPCLGTRPYHAAEDAFGPGADTHVDGPARAVDAALAKTLAAMTMIAGSGWANRRVRSVPATVVDIDRAGLPGDCSVRWPWR